jgi:uncharacterized protein YecT (DUF1311 family)
LSVVLRILALLAAAAALAVTAADAQQASAQPPIDCKAASNQMELDYCAGQDFKAADAKLNSVYQQLMAKYDVANQALLRSAEEKWIAWRDAECSYETALTVGGTIHSMMETECDTEKTTAHIKELERERDCEEGDITCNPPL